MYCDDGFLGAPEGVESLKSLNEHLSARVIARVTTTQELVTMNNFEHESSEYLLRKTLQERISDVESWRWVFEDLSRRLDASIDALKYECGALRVVVTRIEAEKARRSAEVSRPGALTPQTDSVEEAIAQEYKFLRDQEKDFKKMVTELEVRTAGLEKVKKRIEDDVINKQQAIELDEKCSNMSLDSNTSGGKKKKKAYSPMNRWENRCYSLKKKGLCALSHALSIRQQVRAARSQLSVAAQAYSTRVETALRRRIHSNQSKLQELQWQREESARDHATLSEELTTSEKNTLATMEKISLMEARIADRARRPARELTRDEVDFKLRDELRRLKGCLKYLRKNIELTTSLQHDLTASIAQINCVEEDVLHVLRLDEERTRGRYEDPGSTGSPGGTSTSCDPRQDFSPKNGSKSSRVSIEIPLSTIAEDAEEEEIDDYPLNY